VTRTRTPAIGVVLLLSATLALAGCASSATPSAAPTADATVTVPAPTETVSGSEAPTGPDAPSGEPTCDGIIPSTTVEAFTKEDWTFREDPFYVGNINLAGGIQCTWGNASVASDQVQVFGWAPMTDAQRGEVEKELVDSGWKKFTEDGVEYITATDDMIMNPDDDGYGMTYRFGKGQITFADTKQGLLLVEWPRR
jgi:hypothetical protein